jgi:hypothetical protein
VCEAGAALDEWRKETGDKGEPGQLIHVYLNPEYEREERT